MTQGIRSYGPGKFDTILDSHLWELSLDGSIDEECGESETTGWYGLLLGPFDPVEGFTDEENYELTHACGAILSENSQGFVSVQTYTDRGELSAEWKSVQREVEHLESQIEGDAQ